MSKGKKARAKEHKMKKIVKKVVQKHHIATTFHRKELPWLCNQWAYGNIGAKK
jgi:hypothetical protein